MNTKSDINLVEKACTAQEIFQRDTRWINECHMIIAEVSTPSHGVGFEIDYGLSIGKPVYCFHCSDKVISKMFIGNPTEYLNITHYDNGEELCTKVHHLIVYCRQDKYHVNPMTLCIGKID
ncbi:MAG: nucleoside 2-deoxyribosyltransferase [Anaerolineaceae bacterium]|nr:nucleoside 2-deoxyribosyltransferase [Anaerolineaceae bacterium]